MRLRTTFLYMAQPAARLAGRLRHGLSPWRRRSAPRLGLPLPRTASIWSERWQAPDQRVRGIEAALRRNGGVVFPGGDFERWDLHVRGGMLGSMRMRMAVEEHGSGRQLLRVRSWPRCSRIGAGVALGFAVLAGTAALSSAWVVAGVMAAVVALILASIVKDCATAAGVLKIAIGSQMREAELDYEPVSAVPAVVRPRIASNGHGPDTAPAPGAPVTTNGAAELPGQGVAFGSPLHMAERRIDLHEGDQ